MPAILTPTAPDFLTSQRAILLDAPDNDTVIRRLLAAACDEIDTVRARCVVLEARLQEAMSAQARRPTPTLRPAILALIRTRGEPLTRAQIEEGMEAGTRLAEPLRRMVQDGRLTLVDGRYALPPDPAGAPASAGPLKRGGRTRQAVA